jgi:hypothetical protein
MKDTDARRWHPWLRINRVLRVMLGTSPTGTAWERTPWQATQRAAREAITKADVAGEVGGEE